MGSVTGDCRPGTALIGRAWNSPGEINLRVFPLPPPGIPRRDAQGLGCSLRIKSRLSAESLLYC